jgi:hypothetical protein
MSYPATIDTFTTKVDTTDDVLAADINAPQTAITAIETELGINPAGSQTDLATRLIKSIDAAGNLNPAASTVLTISGGSITVTQNWHRIDTEAGASSDNLDTITSAADGYLLVLRTVADARDVVIRHGVGNILTTGGQDITLGLAGDLAILIYDDNLDKWLALGPGAQLNGANTWTGPQIWGSGESHKWTAVNADTTLDGTHCNVGVDASGAARTITLPTAVGIPGRTYTVIKTDSSGNAVTIDGDGAETINGAATYALAAQYDGVTIISTGVGWIVKAVAP